MKEELAELVQTLSEEDASRALDYLRWLLEDDETLSEDEMEEVRRGRDEIARGEWTSLDDLNRELGL